MMYFKNAFSSAFYLYTTVYLEALELINMLKNNIAIVSKNDKKIKIITNIIGEMESNIFIYDTVDDLKNNTDNAEMDAIFCYYDEIIHLPYMKNFKHVFIIDQEFNEENKKLAYENSIYEYMYEPLQSMDILHRLAIIKEEKLELYISKSASISLLTQLVNIKDGNKNGHLIRMRNIVGLFLEELIKDKKFSNYLTEGLCYDITQASLLHDIGKMIIPDKVLHKSGTLSFYEFAMMQQHPTTGQEVLSANYNKFRSNNIIKLAIDIAESHHERWDGGGYPNKLKGEKIPLNARIVAICDVYDTITTSNSYKASSSHAQSFQTVLLEGGKRFDPDLVAVFAHIGNAIESGKQSRFTKMKTFNSKQNLTS